MRTWILVLIVGLTTSACVPSFSYRLGQGFYSDNYAKVQVQSAANAGRVKNLGRFTTNAGGCGNYTQTMADQNIVVPAIKAKLKELGANVADNVVANEEWYDVILGLLIIPALLACSNWTISGDALLVEGPSGQAYPGIAGLDRFPLIFFKDRE
jgi:hypothetical protein